MKKWTRYGACCGAFLLLLLGVAAFDTYYGMKPVDCSKDVPQCLYNFVSEWQTLITGLMALFVGGWTVLNLQEQMQMQKSQQERSERRKELVAKAQLPDALAEITQYASACLSRLVEEGEQFTAPEHPADAIGVVKIALEFVEREPAEVLLELVHEYQIHNSRLAHQGGAYWRFERGANAIELYWRAERLFMYARGEEPTVAKAKPGLEEMQKCVRRCADLSHYLENRSKYAGVETIIQSNFGPR